MKRNFKIILTLILLTLNIQTLHAKLTWPDLEKTVNATPTDKEASVTFDGINLDAETVEITNIEKSCGCASVTPSRTKIEHGQTTKLQTKISLTPIGGPQTKTITVRTNDGLSQTLQIHIQMPETFTVSKPAFLWQQTTTPQTLTVSLKPQTQFIKSESLSDQFLIKDERTKDQISLTLTPIPTITPTKSSLKLSFKYQNSPINHYIPLEFSNQPPSPPSPPTGPSNTQISQTPPSNETPKPTLSNTLPGLSPSNQPDPNSPAAKIRKLEQRLQQLENERFLLMRELLQTITSLTKPTVPSQTTETQSAASTPVPQPASPQK